MPRVFYDRNALFMEGREDPFPAGTLVATTDDLNPGWVQIRVVNMPGLILALPFGDIQARDGSTFLSLDATLAYLAGEFAKRRPVGDLYAVPIAIAQAGQTRIPLDIPPGNPNALRLEVNGVVYRPPDIGVSDIAVTWLAEDFPLTPSDRIAVVYS